MADATVPRQGLMHLLCRKSKQLKGDKILLELIYHPNQRIHSSQLNNLFNVQGRGTREFDDKARFNGSSLILVDYGWCELPIEMTDKRTLIECRERLQRLLTEEENLEDWNDLGRLQDIREEKMAILEFIRLCVTASGNIKYIQNKQHNDYRAILRTLNRSIRWIGKIDPNLEEYIRRHLVIGIYCEWQEDL